MCKPYTGDKVTATLEQEQLDLQTTPAAALMEARNPHVGRTRVISRYLPNQIKQNM